MPTEQDWSEDRALFADGRVAELGPLSNEFIRLAENLLTATSVHGVLDRVVQAARVAVPGADLVSVLIGANDLFIAAHARSSGLTLVTNNTAEFSRVTDLSIENWTVDQEG